MVADTLLSSQVNFASPKIQGFYPCPLLVHEDLGQLLSHMRSGSGFPRACQPVFRALA